MLFLCVMWPPKAGHQSRSPEKSNKDIEDISNKQLWHKTHRYAQATMQESPITSSSTNRSAAITKMTMKNIYTNYNGTNHATTKKRSSSTTTKTNQRIDIDRKDNKQQGQGQRQGKEEHLQQERNQVAAYYALEWAQLPSRSSSILIQSRTITTCHKHHFRTCPTMCHLNANTQRPEKDTKKWEVSRGCCGLAGCQPLEIPWSDADDSYQLSPLENPKSFRQLGNCMQLLPSLQAGHLILLERARPSWSNSSTPPETGNLSILSCKLLQSLGPNLLQAVLQIPWWSCESPDELSRKQHNIGCCDVCSKVIPHFIVKHVEWQGGTCSQSTVQGWSLCPAMSVPQWGVALKEVGVIQHPKQIQKTCNNRLECVVLYSVYFGILGYRRVFLKLIVATTFIDSSWFFLWILLMDSCRCFSSLLILLLDSGVLPLLLTPCFPVSRAPYHGSVWASHPASGFRSWSGLRRRWVGCYGLVAHTQGTPVKHKVCPWPSMAIMTLQDIDQRTHTENHQELYLMDYIHRCKPNA